jgi:pyruvate dehydrogenase E2 component (dihydrolipoamide acetyltransferase)
MGNFKDVAVIDVLVKPGDAIEVDGPLVTLETEKATMDVPSTVAGVIDKIVATKGGTVSPGDVVATVSVEEGVGAAAPAAASPAPAPDAAPAKAAAPAPAAAAPSGATLAAVNESGFSSAHASPSVRRFARELGVDLSRVTGTGFKSRITEEDVKGFVKKALSGGGGAPAPGVQGGRGLPSVPVVDFAAFGAVETKPLTRIQKISGSRLHASWVNLPHVTQFDEADITDLEELRNKLKTKAAEQGIKLTPLAFIIRACVRALHHFPTFNSSLDASGENLVLKKYIHIGFAADTPNGLMVPVVRDADRKDIYEVARDLSELSEKARTGTLNVAQMQGGSFTISSLGGIGGTAFTPIINAPEVAILGVSRSAMKPVFKDGAFVPRLLLPLSLSYDHRVIDGALAAKFTTYLAQVLAEPRLLLEAVP